MPLYRALPLTISGSSLLFSNTAQVICADTVDGSDNKSIIIAGGGAGTPTRGGVLTVTGNESGSSGSVLLQGGDTTVGHVILRVPNSSAQMQVQNGAGSPLWSVFAANGALVQNATNGGDLAFGQTTANIRQDTVDGSDTKQLRITGGGAIGASRGGYIVLAGNESGNSGAVQLFGGDVAGANVDIYTSASGNNIRFYGNNLLGWSMTGAARDFTQDGTNGGNIVLSRGNTSVVQRVATAVTAAGTNSATATVLDSIYNAVTTVAAGTGVRLTNVANGGSPVYVQNLGANDLEVYPPTGGAINAAATDAGITLTAASDQIGVFVRYNTNSWMGFVVNAPST